MSSSDRCSDAPADGNELRTAALYWLAMTDPAAKAAGVRALAQRWQSGTMRLDCDAAFVTETDADAEIDAEAEIKGETEGEAVAKAEAKAKAEAEAETETARPRLPGRPARPLLVPPLSVPRRSMASVEGRAVLLHALAHIEFNAINLALDACWRFAGMPAAYYTDWLEVAAEEALHFTLLSDHLRGQGFAYGDFPAHDSLWELAHATRRDVLARIALVPRTMEARGLDASPPMRAKLAQAGDADAAAILDIILRDEIGHVAVGNRWFAWLCAARGLEPLSTYASLAAQFRAPLPRGPFNVAARRAAGFSEAELSLLTGTAPD